MRKHNVAQMLSGLFFMLIVCLAGTRAAQGQFAQKRDTIKVDPSGFPPEVQRGYRLFGAKCSECHGLDTSLKPTMSASQWPYEVKRMQSMPSSQFNDAQAKAILTFLNYYEANRKSLNQSEAQAGPSGADSAGRQVYDAQGCANCHAIAGKGGTAGPSLSDIGKRLPKEQLTEVIRKGKGSMPPLPASTTDQQLKDMVDFLAGTNSEPQKSSGGAPKEPATAAAQGSKPAAEAASSGTESKPAAEAGASGAGGAGRQLYDKQGCANCHAIAGKGGTSGPSLSDVGKRLSKAQLTEVIRKGKGSMPPLPAGTTDQQLKELVDFVAGPNNQPQKENGGTENKPETPPAQGSKPAAPTAPSGSDSKQAAQTGGPGGAAAGRQVYDKQGCAKCHAIAGKGGTSGPSLNDIGKRLSREQLTEVIRKGKSSMPPLAAGATEQQTRDLVNYLVTLNKEPPKQNASTQKAAETSTDRGSSSSRPPSGENVENISAVDTNHGAMLLSSTLLLLIAVTAVLIGVLVFRPGLTATPDGKILAFFVLFLLPIICAGIGTTYHIDRSKSTKFCLSCHEMEPFGKSLLVDGPAHLPAAHFQNHRVPAGEACFTCHSNYAMFGGFHEKIQGLREVYKHYLGKPPAPEAIRLSDRFNNRECLHCHLGARSFEEGAAHTANPYLLPAVKGNQVSCLSSGCHQTVHDIAGLKTAKFWKGNP